MGYGLLKNHGILLLLLIGVFVTRSTGTTLNPYSGTGDWVLTQSELISDQTIVIDGNLIIESPGTIAFSNVTLLVKGTIIINQGTHNFINCRIENQLGPTIEIYSPDNKFTNNTIVGTANDQILIFQTTGITFEGNNITHRGIASNGISIQQSSSILITGNHIQTTGGIGVIITNSDMVIVDFNTIGGGEFVTAYAVDVTNTTELQLIGNELSSNASRVVKIHDSDVFIVGNDFVELNSSDELLVVTQSSMELRHNKFGSPISLFKSTGVLIDDSMPNFIQNNLFYTTYGLNITASEFQHVERNEFIGNTIGLTMDQIFSELGDKETWIKDNNFTKVQTGVNLRNLQDLVVEGNRFNDSQSGFSLESTSNSLFSGMHYYNTSKAMYLSNSHHNIFDADNHNEADEGYTLVNSVGNNFTNGRIDLLTETGYGFTLSDSDRTYFNNITVSGHGRGILIQEFSNNVLMYDLNISTIREGLYVTHSGGFLVENSSFSGGVLPIYIDDIEQWLPENRINFVNITTPWQGMFVSDNRGNLVIENSLIKTNLTSLQFVSSSSITMRYNEISSDAEDGLRVLMTQGVHAINNKFHSEQACGVLILQPRSIGNAENLFEQNNITGACGVRINSDDFQRFSNNNITGLTEDAIFVDVLNSNTEFSNNRVTGTIIGPIAFEVEMGLNLTLGDTLEVVYLNVESLTDGIDLHYQFDDLAPSITHGSQIFLGIPNVDNLAIWTEVSGGNGNLNMFRIDVAIGIGKEFVNPIVSTTNQTEFEFESGEAFVLVGTATDTFPATYLVYVDGEKIDELEFLPETSFRIPLIFIELGMHTVVLDFIDSSGNVGSIEYIITIIDTTPPELTVAQEFTFIAGQSPQRIEFQASDLHLDTYTVIMNGVVLVVEVLTSTTGSFKLAPYNLESGVYEFQISIRDTSGNGAAAMVTIHIVDPVQTTSDTTSDTSLSTSDSLISGLLFIQFTFVTMIAVLVRRKKIQLKLD